MRIVLSLTQIQLWIWEEQLFETKLQRLYHGNPSLNSTITPSTFGKYNSLTMSQPHFEGNVRSPLTLLKMGLGSPSRLPKTQSVIARVKTPRIKAFFIPLERSWSVDVQNDLAWAIWTSATQVMVERRARSQIGSLTLDH
jgi:hypothetical protein